MVHIWRFSGLSKVFHDWTKNTVGVYHPVSLNLSGVVRAGARMAWSLWILISLHQSTKWSSSINCWSNLSSLDQGNNFSFLIQACLALPFISGENKKISKFSEILGNGKISDPIPFVTVLVPDVFFSYWVLFALSSLKNHFNSIGRSYTYHKEKCKPKWQSLSKYNT